VTQVATKPPHRRRRLLLSGFALSTLVGILCAAVASGLLPPGAGSSVRESAATGHFLIDLPSPSVLERRGPLPAVETLVKHAELLGRVVASPPILERIADRAGIRRDRISATARTTADVPLALAEPGSEQRASEIVRSRKPYRLEIQSRLTTPIVDVYTQAPTTAEAMRVADAVVPALRDYLNELADKREFPRDRQVQLQQLGAARGGVVSGSGTVGIIAFLGFLVGFGLTASGWVAAILFMRRRRGAPARPRPPRPERRGAGPPEDDDWPRTTRVLPWLAAGLMAMIWLTPFNQMQLGGGGAPIDLKLDRLVLPVVVVVWVLALAAGGRAAPRLRFTWIHGALGALVAIGFVSVVLDARYLNHVLELDLAVKKLPLLLSYLVLFLIVASSVRRSEVRAFLNYTLGLAALCGLGLVIEYRLHVNLFYDISSILFPIFQFDDSLAGTVDSIGRFQVHGPAEPGVEAVGMLAMALPIAMVGFMSTKETRAKVLYGLAACALAAGMFATFRKTALLAPVSVVLTLAYFRRRELLKLAPLAMVLVVVVSALSPGAMGSTMSQFFRSDRTQIGTVSDRTADYDAIRPDLWSNIAFGRGWGTYNHESYRILDSEILHRTVETGVLGLLAFLLTPLSVLFCARRMIGARDPDWSPLAVIGTAAAICFLTISTLYDALSFPHATYVFLCMAALVAALTARDRRTAEEAPPAPEEQLPQLVAAPRLLLPSALPRTAQVPVGASRLSGGRP
jgi:hypothetical protein